MIEVGLKIWRYIFCSLNYECVIIWLGKIGREHTRVCAFLMMLVTWSLESHREAMSLEGGRGWWRHKFVLPFMLRSHVLLTVYALKHVDPTLWVILGVSKAAFNIRDFCLTHWLRDWFLDSILPHPSPVSQVRKLSPREGLPSSLCIRGRVRSDHMPS